MASHFLTGLDIGTTSIKVAVAEERNGRALLRAVFKEPSFGLRRGAVVDLGEGSGTDSSKWKLLYWKVN